MAVEKSRLKRKREIRSHDRPRRSKRFTTTPDVNDSDDDYDDDSEYDPDDDFDVSVDFNNPPQKKTYQLGPEGPWLIEVAAKPSKSRRGKGATTQFIELQGGHKAG